jgi:hypothetical protein
MTQQEELPTTTALTTTYERIDEGILKLNLLTEVQQFEQFWRHSKMTNVGQNMYCTSVVEVILKF